MISSPDEALAALRAGDPDAQEGYAALAHVTGAQDATERAALRAAVAALLAGSVRPTDAPLARWLLKQEAAFQREIPHTDAEALYVLVAVVARFADPADTLLLWRAREANSETRGAVDVEQLLRAGAEPARRRLHSLIAAGGPDAEEARRALAWIDAGISDGAANDLSGYFAWSDERFGLRVSGPT